MRVAINAQLLPGGGAGGVEQFIIGLVHALGQLNDGPEEYLIIGPWQDPYWLESYLCPNQRIVPGPKPQPGRMESLKHLLGPLPNPVGKLWRGARRFILSPPKPPMLAVPASDGFYESLGAEVVHFPYQSGFVCCNLPMIYNPHDLQHLRYPQFFKQETIAWRETIYRKGCHLAQAVAVESKWVKDDIIQHYKTSPEKVYVIPLGAATDVYEQVSPTTLACVQQRFQLPQTFALYPAQTWPHKNHIRLLEAIALLRDQHSLSVDLVCTGRQNDFWSAIAQRIRELGLENQVRFLGFVSPTELRALYQLAQFTVIPTLFEGWGFPMLEAFREGTPVACSAVAPLQEHGGDAVLFFDPVSVESIAEAMRRMTTDAELRATLHQGGAARIRLFTWERTATAYRGLYRKVAGHPLSDEERYLLATDWARS